MFTKRKDRKLAEKVLLIIVLVWFVVSVSAIYTLNSQVNKAIVFSQKLGKVIEEWRGLAYSLDPETAYKLEEKMKEEYGLKKKKPKKKRIEI